MSKKKVQPKHLTKKAADFMLKMPMETIMGKSSKTKSGKKLFTKGK